MSERFENQSLSVKSLAPVATAARSSITRARLVWLSELPHVGMDASECVVVLRVLQGWQGLPEAEATVNCTAITVFGSRLEGEAEHVWALRAHNVVELVRHAAVIALDAVAIVVASGPASVGIQSIQRRRSQASL